MKDIPAWANAREYMRMTKDFGAVEWYFNLLGRYALWKATHEVDDRQAFERVYEAVAGKWLVGAIKNEWGSIVKTMDLEDAKCATELLGLWMELAEKEEDTIIEGYAPLFSKNNPDTIFAGINFAYTDTEIIKEFRQWLRKNRAAWKELRDGGIRSWELKFDEWRKKQILLYVDFVAWGKMTGVKLKNEDLMEVCDYRVGHKDEGKEAAEHIRKVIKPCIKDCFDHTLWQLKAAVY